jgi:uncharacterized repeat protein (TIGR02543 family)
MKQFRILSSKLIALICTVSLILAFTACKKEESNLYKENDVKPNEFTVLFNSNEGSSVPSQTVKDGEKAIKPDNPTRNGYKFVAWFKEAELANEWKFDIDIVTSDVTLYAKWVEKETLIFEFHRVGGWICLDEKLQINADSTYFSITYLSDTWKSYKTTIKTSDNLWIDLKRTFDLDAFKKIEDGPCFSCGDGYDDLFFVITDTETCSIYNGNDDVHFKQMQGFFNLLFEQAEYFEKLAGFSK